jgi:nicotinate-nucleotide pyrophosphorylase (carboxylating)
MSIEGFPDADYVLARIDEALREDGVEDDCTVSFLVLGDRSVDGRLIAQAPGVIAGIQLALMTFSRLDPELTSNVAKKDGDRVKAGDTIAEIHGRAGAILSAERVALNFLQSLSGVATLTGRFVDKVRGSGVTILDTRKTTPLFRPLQRYAVRVGGGVNHRFNLSEMILIKENHIRSLGGTKATLDVLSRAKPDRQIEVEVDTMDFLRELLGCPVDRIMLDNFAPKDVRRAVEMVSAYRGRHPASALQLEASGGIRLDNVAEYAIAGLDYISVGALTHSAPALDISLEVTSYGQ